jgi:mRNA interferase MazF
MLSGGTAKVGTKSRMKRGEIRWYTFRPPDKRRPVLLLTRDPVIEQLGEIIAAPVTRPIRGLATEVLLTTDDGMPVACAANFDHVGLAQRARIGVLICELPVARWPEVRAAILVACGSPMAVQCTDST